MEWKLLASALIAFLAVLLCGFLFIPVEPPLFGMGMVPGPLALLRTLGVPGVASVGMGIVVYRRANARKKSNTALFWGLSVILWGMVWVLVF
jgi:hypothetical protein